MGGFAGWRAGGFYWAGGSLLSSQKPINQALPVKILRKRSESKPFNIKSLVSSSCIITVKIDLSQQKGNPHQTPADFVDIADGYLSMPSREQAPEKYFSGRGCLI